MGYYYNDYSNPKNRYTPQYKQELLNGAVDTAITQGSTSQAQAERVDSDYGNKDLYIRSFLINTNYNASGWAVSPETIWNNVYSIVGKPLVLDRNPTTGKADHPHWNSTKSAQANMIDHERKAIGVVEKVFYNKDTDSYYADSRITDPYAREYIKQFHGRKIPIRVSPQLIYNEKTEEPNYYKNWEFSHLAIVDNAAFGEQAQVIGLCNGNGEKCHKELQKQHQQAVAAASASSTRRYVYQLTIPPNGKKPGHIA
jgi:hypothetical protein